MSNLLKFAHPVSIPYLIERLGDEDTLVKTGAENTLIKIGEEAVQALFEPFKSGTAETRLRAVFVYSGIGTETELQNLVKLLYDTDTDVRGLVIKRLEKGLTKDSSIELWKLVKKSDESEFIREIASKLLCLNVTSIEDIILEDIKSDELDNISLGIGSQLYLKMQPLGHEYFTKFIKSEVPDLRILALISHKDPKEALKMAKTMTEDDESEVRKMAVEMIGVYGTKNELELLNDLKNTPSLGVWQVSKKAIEAINSR
jgi:HEAT repeat protein